ncbi:MAG: flagellar hook capping FlgD N-terminal domain-containing protein [Burkholderiaceae bacterium]
MANTINPLAGTSTNPSVKGSFGAPGGAVPSFDQILQSSTVRETATAASTTESASSLGADNDATEDRFLALLVAQMRNQDPLNPLENAEVTTQLAQINTVRGIEDLGKSMKSLLERLSQQGPINSASMIDRQVLVPASSVDLTDADMEPVKAAAELTLPAQQVVADIYGTDGVVLRSLDLGAHGPGLVNFEWDGRDAAGEWAPEGRYTLRVRALGSDGEQDPATSVARRVVGIERGSDGLNLRLQGGASVPESSIRAIF